MGVVKGPQQSLIMIWCYSKMPTCQAHTHWERGRDRERGERDERLFISHGWETVSECEWVGGRAAVRNKQTNSHRRTDSRARTAAAVASPLWRSPYVNKEARFVSDSSLFEPRYQVGPDFPFWIGAANARTHTSPEPRQLEVRRSVNSERSVFISRFNPLHVVENCRRRH